MMESLIDKVVKCGNKGAIKTRGGSDRFEVVAEFDNQKDMREFYSALGDLWESKGIMKLTIEEATAGKGPWRCD